MKNNETTVEVEHLVVDSNAFLKNFRLEKLGRNVYTCIEVVSEIRDSATRERLQVLPYELKFLNPAPEAIKTVSDFAKKTGDYSSLSAVDLKVLASVYTLEVEHCGADNLKSEPTIQVSQRCSNFRPQSINPRSLAGFYIPKSVIVDSEKDCEHSGGKEEVGELEAVERLEKLALSDGEEESEEDESDWITPHNFNEALEKMGAGLGNMERELKPVSVACLTTDFAMQNVLLHMGLKVISVDGLLVKKLKTFVLRCHACFKTTSVMTKKFCPSCGNSTLDKVSVSVNPEDGSLEYHLSTRKQKTLRGLKYSLPAPKGGKHAWNPVLVEDQPLPQNRMSKKTADWINPMEPEYLARDSPLSVNDVTSKSAVLGLRTLGKQERIKNPNSGWRGRKRGGKRR